MSEQHQPKPMMRPSKVAMLLGVHRATVWRWAQEGNFPKPVKLGRGVAAWYEEDVIAFQRRRQAESGATELDTTELGTSNTESWGWQLANLSADELKERGWSDEDRETFEHDPFVPPMSAIMSLCYM